MECLDPLKFIFRYLEMLLVQRTRRIKHPGHGHRELEIVSFISQLNQVNAQESLKDSSHHIQVLGVVGLLSSEQLDQVRCTTLVKEVRPKLVFAHQIGRCSLL